MRYMLLMGDLDDLMYIGEGDTLPEALENLLVEVIAESVEADIEDLSNGLEALEVVALQQAIQNVTP